MQIFELFSVVMHNYYVQGLMLHWRSTQHHNRAKSVWLWFVFGFFLVKKQITFFFFFL